jgi:hypothetical protein
MERDIFSVQTDKYQVEGYMNSKVPTKLPKEWVNQIREAAKSDTPTLWVTLLGTGLGSAFIAALIGVGASLAVEHYKAQQASNLELEKARIEIKKERLEERQKLFEKLASYLGQLQTETGNAAGTLAVTKPDDMDLPVFAQVSLTKIEDLMANVFELNRDERIDPNIRGRVRTLLNSLDPVVKAAKQDSKHYAAFVDLSNQHLDREIGEIKKMIDDALNKMTV